MKPASVVLALALVVSGCATGGGSAALRAPGPLEARSVQSRELGTSDTRLVLKAAVGALQDEGFTIRQTDSGLGLVTATAEWQSRAESSVAKILKWAAVPMTYGASLLVPSGRREFSTVEATVNVTSEGERTRVRVSLALRVTDDRGRVRGVTTVGDPSVYQRLLARIDKALYLEREGL
jgi:hypothetical protein